jgi:hypothetical protein
MSMPFTIYAKFMSEFDKIREKVRHYAISPKVVGSRHDVNEFFILPNPSGCTRT